MVRCRRVTSTATQQTGFVFPLDSFVSNDITKKPLVDSQKPVAFFKSLLQLHTVKGEWVLIGYSGIGMQSDLNMHSNNRRAQWKKGISPFLTNSGFMWQSQD